jgi:hypothetical protein
MTPKEKAKELVGIYKNLYGHPTEQYLDSEDAKMCALIAVDEIINSSPSLPILGDSGTYGEDIELSKIYWEEVKYAIDEL